MAFLQSILLIFYVNLLCLLLYKYIVLFTYGFDSITEELTRAAAGIIVTDRFEAGLKQVK